MWKDKIYNWKKKSDKEEAKEATTLNSCILSSLTRKKQGNRSQISPQEEAILQFIKEPRILRIQQSHKNSSLQLN